jgi:hypothetical protein
LIQEITDLFQDPNPGHRMSTESIDRTTPVSTIDQAGPSRAALSPFFIAAIGMTIALVVIAAAIALMS